MIEMTILLAILVTHVKKIQIDRVLQYYLTQIGELTPTSLYSYVLTWLLSFLASSPQFHL